MKTFILFLCLIAIICAEHTANDFEYFKGRFSKKYPSESEDFYRQKIFEENLDYINRHNLEYEQGMHTFTLGVNEYADLSTDEWRMFLLGADVYKSSEVDIEENLMDESVPDSVDWRTEGYVTDVKNQGHCGSCWAFSAVGSMEGAWFKKQNKLVSLSEQNLVDCDKESLGCKGGNMEQAFSYVIKIGGIDTEASYPYKGVNGHCNFTKDSIGASIRSFEKVKRNDEEALQKAVAKVGPVSVGIDASRPSFHLYKNGTYYDKTCSSVKLDHGVLVVGYGPESEDNKEDGQYWIVKNSWGPSWGMKGYINMSRNKNNNCGIATDASYSIA